MSLSGKVAFVTGGSSGIGRAAALMLAGEGVRVGVVGRSSDELAQDRVRVNVICPGAIETNIDQNTQQRNVEKVREPVEFPEGSIPLTDGKPPGAEEVAKLVRFLASDESRHISGTEIYIDGAESLLEG